MNTYDQLALSNSPLFYLATPNVSDQSGTSTYVLTNNGVASDGQAIITGHSSSFKITSTSYLDIAGDFGFFNKNHLIELVIRCSKPEMDIPVIHDPNNLFGLYVTEDGIFLRLKFDNNGDISIAENGKLITQWNKKYYIKILFLENNVNFIINGEIFEIEYDGDFLTTTDVQIGSNAIDDYSFNIDGLGVYSTLSVNKENYINDFSNGYSEISSKLFLGTNTLFETAEFGFSEIITKSQFAGEESGINYYTFYIPVNDEPYSYFIVRVDNETQSFGYKVDSEDTWSLFSNDFIIPNDPETNSIGFAWAIDDDVDDFKLVVIGVIDPDIYRNSPAIMSLTGFALYPELTDSSIVNNPRGVRLFESYYSGTLQNNSRSVTEFHSIEIVFKAHNLLNKTYVFSSSDGEVSFGPGGAITGFTAYLNGEVILNLNSIDVDQWYHLVLTSNTTLAEEFFLNYSSTPETEAQDISYLLLSIYEIELIQQNVDLLLSVLTGSDIISVEDTNTIITEGITDTGTAYKAYAYTWAIVGAGGQ